MRIELIENLKKFHEITIQITEALKDENYDELQGLFDRKQELINNMNTLTYTKDEFKEICNELEIIKIEKEVNIVLNEKKNKIKKMIGEASGSRTAHQSYRRISSSNVSLLNMKM